MSTLPDRSAARRRICLFAQYNRAETLPDSLFHYLCELKRAGFETVVALSGKSNITDADCDRLDELGVRAVTRANAGLDFGAWAMLVRAGAAEGADEILLANDSVVGPFAPLAPIVADMAGFDAWGMVESREGRPHLQSWFVCLSAAALASGAVGRVFAQPFEAMSKPEIIAHGELGLGAAFEAESLGGAARHRSVFRLRPSLLVAINPMHFRWRPLLRSGLVPFLKLELLRDNPSRILGLHDWRRVIGDAGIDELSWIEVSLADRTGRPSGLPGLRSSVLQFLLREDRAALLADLLAQVSSRTKTAGREPGRSSRRRAEN